MANKQVERKEELEGGRVIQKVLWSFGPKDLDYNDGSGIGKRGRYGITKEELVKLVDRE